MAFISHCCRAYARLVSGVAALLLVSACGNVVEVSNRDFNDGLAGGQASTILANVVRSAKGYPTYFTVAGDYQQSQQVQSSPSISYDPGIDGGIADLNLSLSPSASTSSSSTASSLETSDFTEAMHTQVSPELLVKLAASRDEAHLHLTLMLLIQTLAVTQTDYNSLISSAQFLCNTRSSDLPASQRGMCKGLLSNVPPKRCSTFGQSSQPNLVLFVNDPTSLCQFERFRTLIESIAILQPRLGFTEPKSNERGGGKLIYLGDSVVSTRQIFAVKGTGFRLRSPSQIVFYLGQLVNESYAGVDLDRLSISTTEGGLAPIFHVRSGEGNASVSTIVDGERYWLEAQNLGDVTDDFSHRSMTLIKDLIALNTLQDQLPQNTAVFVAASQ
ncbi:MAG: hypothetical protein AAGA28_19065 [Pseudomonadota bacterium]